MAANFVEFLRAKVCCRPFTAREVEEKQECIVAMERGSKVAVFNPQTGQVDRFSVEAAYWNHNPEDHNFIHQSSIAKEQSFEMLDKAWDGISTALLVVGGPSSGKSFALFGNKNTNVPGIVDITCQHVFAKINQETTATTATTATIPSTESIQSSTEEATETTSSSNTVIRYTIHCSLLEVCSEHVRDLLNPKNEKHQGTGLRIKEHVDIGTYVDSQKFVQVCNFEDFQRLVEGGLVERAGASNMSSLLLRIRITQQLPAEEHRFPIQRISNLDFVEVASDWSVGEGCDFESIMSGQAVDLPRASLCRCIAAFSNNEVSSASEPITYSDSALTWILKNVVDGNSLLSMYAALSPCAADYHHTKATLVLVDRARRISKRVRQNDLPTLLISEPFDPLSSTPASLRQWLTETGRRQSSQMQLVELRQQQHQQQQQASLVSSPYHRAFCLFGGATVIGSSRWQCQVPEVVLDGEDVCSVHAIIHIKEYVAVISPVDGNTFINGVKIKAPTQLTHGCRIGIGSQAVLIFNDGQDTSNEKPELTTDIQLCYEELELRMPLHMFEVLNIVEAAIQQHQASSSSSLPLAAAAAAALPITTTSSSSSPSASSLLSTTTRTWSGELCRRPIDGLRTWGCPGVELTLCGALRYEQYALITSNLPVCARVYLPGALLDHDDIEIFVSLDDVASDLRRKCPVASHARDGVIYPNTMVISQVALSLVRFVENAFWRVVGARVGACANRPANIVMLHVAEELLKFLIQFRVALMVTGDDHCPFAAADDIVKLQNPAEFNLGSASTSTLASKNKSTEHEDLVYDDDIERKPTDFEAVFMGFAFSNNAAVVVAEGMLRQLLSCVMQGGLHGYRITYPLFQCATADLQRVDVSHLNRWERFAFLANLYNCLTLHAHLEIDHEDGDDLEAELDDMFHDARYRVGDEDLTLDDIHQQLLGAAHPHTNLVSSASDFFSGGFFSSAGGWGSRLASTVGLGSEAVDLRIPFALWHGTVSANPLCVFQTEHVEAQLNACVNFVMRRDFAMDTANNVAYLPAVFKWYSNNFGSKDAVWAFVRKHYSTSALCVAPLPTSHANIKFKYREYDYRKSVHNSIQLYFHSLQDTKS